MYMRASHLHGNGQLLAYRHRFVVLVQIVKQIDPADQFLYQRIARAVCACVRNMSERCERR